MLKNKKIRLFLNISAVSLGNTCEVAFQRRDGSELTKITVEGKGIYVMSREFQKSLVS